VDLLEALLLAACFAVIEIPISSFQIPHFEVTIESLIHVLTRNDPRKENRKIYPLLYSKMTFDFPSEAWFFLLARQNYLVVHVFICFFAAVLLFYLCSCVVLLFAGKMSDMRPKICSFLLKANKKLTCQSSYDRNREAHRERTAEALLPVRDDPTEEEEMPLKRKRSAPSDKGKRVQTAPSSTPISEGKLIELPNVWLKPDKFGPQSTLILGDRELKMITDLGVAGKSEAMTEGIIGAMKALEIVVVLNNSSTEGMICADAMAKERDEAVAEKEKLDKKLAGVEA